MKIILIILAILITTSSKSFSLTYKKLETPMQVKWQDGSVGGKAMQEGFFGGENDFPNCKKLNHKIETGSLLRQGLTIFYRPDGKINSSENGLFDCKLNKGSITLVLDEGIGEMVDQTTIAFKKENSNNHFYVYKKYTNEWLYWVRNVDAAYSTEFNSNFQSRPATQEEIKHAEKLLTIYKNLDVASPAAKKYSSINNEVNQTQNQIYNKRGISKS